MGSAAQGVMGKGSGRREERGKEGKGRGGEVRGTREPSVHTHKHYPIVYSLKVYEVLTPVPQDVMAES